jgi:hypothetical protein
MEKDQLNLLNKDRVWNRIKNYIYLIIVLFIVIILLLIGLVVSNFFIIYKLYS